MATVNFDSIFNDMKNGVAILAKETLVGYAKQATTEGHQLLGKMKWNLERWSKQVANGEMGIDDLTFLVEGQKELLEMKGLQQFGIGKIQLDKFRNGVANLIVTTIGKLL